MLKVLTKEIQIEVDKEAQAAYIYLGDKNTGSLRSEPVNEDIIIDFSPDGKLQGIEILNLKLLDLSDEI